MRKIAALLSAAIAIWPASSVFAVDLMTQASQQEQVSQDSPNLQSLPGLGQQSFVFGDWGGLRSWLNNKGIDLGLSYLSEPAWNLAGGIAPGGTYAGQENLSLDLNWEKLANINLTASQRLDGTRRRRVAGVLGRSISECGDF
jgi:carbohydrate-selective porin OprB